MGFWSVVISRGVHSVMTDGRTINPSLMDAHFDDEWQMTVNVKKVKQNCKKLANYASTEAVFFLLLKSPQTRTIATDLLHLSLMDSLSMLAPPARNSRR